MDFKEYGETCQLSELIAHVFPSVALSVTEAFLHGGGFGGFLMMDRTIHPVINSIPPGNSGCHKHFHVLNPDIS